MRALRMPVWTLVLPFVALSICQAKTNYAYVANDSDSTVSAIDTSNNTVKKVISVGGLPYGVAVNQAGSTAYVTNYGSDTVSVINTSTNTVIATIPVGVIPLGVAFAPNGKTAYVANWNSGNPGSVSVINTGTKKVTDTIAVQSGPNSVVVSPNGAFVYVANQQGGTVSVISTLTNTVVATISIGGSSGGLAVSPDGSTVYAPTGGKTISVIRTADNSVINTINVEASCFAGVSPDGHWLYSTDCQGGAGNLVTVIDTGTQTVAATIVVGTNPRGVSFSENSSFAYVTNTGSGTVSVINTASKTVVDTITVGTGPTGVSVMGTVKVSTVAGGFVGDKGPATKAAINGPDSSVLDSAGNLYISEFFGGNRIRKVDTVGNITTYAGTGTCGYNGDNILATQASLCANNGLALDLSGNVVVADGSNSRVRKIDHTTGKITTIAGNGVFGYDPSQDGGQAVNAEIGQPFQINYDSAGNLYFDQEGQCVVRKVDTSGIIHTLAGTGTCGYNGDNIPATTAQLNFPRGVVIDSTGNVYIGDTLNHRVRKVDTSGTITTIAGTGKNGFSCNGGPATSANIGNPRGLSIFNNALYIGNGGPKVCAVDLTSGNATLYAGTFLGYDGDGHPLINSEFLSPTTVIFDPSGNPIFDDHLNGRVRKATGGLLSTIAGGYVPEGVSPTATSYGFMEAIAFDKSGNLYIADETGNRVRKVSAGKINTIAGTGISGYSGDGGLGTVATLNQPQGVAVDGNGNVFIADTFNAAIRKVTAGTITTFAPNANYSYLLGMATDSSNNLYVADNGACVVWKITPSAVVSIVAGVLNTCGYNGDGIPATSAQLNGPYSVAVDSHGNFFIADNGNNRIREVNTSGIISTVTGDGNCGYSGNGGSATSAEICFPYGVVVDKAGTVYLSDGNLTVRKISGGIITGYAGTGPVGFGFTGDGMWPLLTNFSEPIALALDSKGAVYVLDDWDHRVRKIQ